MEFQGCIILFHWFEKEKEKEKQFSVQKLAPDKFSVT